MLSMSCLRNMPCNILKSNCRLEASNANRLLCDLVALAFVGVVGAGSEQGL